MLGVDTNVLVRFLVRDDETQFEKARRLIKREVAAGRRVFVNQLVVLETEWVLRSRYGLSKGQIIEAISGLLDASDIGFEDEPAIEEALFIWKDTTADFADCLIGARNRRLGCRATATLDAKASRLPGFMAA
jgi:predicted nucleic-acid-binding protein